MSCSSCGAENRPGSRFCSKCGAALALTCPSCGASADADDRFCSSCGAPLDSPATLAAVSSPATDPTVPTARLAAAGPTTERKLVSVLFADLVGFTTLSEARDAEEVRDLLTRYFDTCRRLIELHGGTVEKFIGDAVMAVWGTPVAQEDDAERAVRAALELTKAVAELGGEVGAPDLKARAGVLTGEAAVTLGAQGQGMVAGDLVNTASRIQSAAEPGTVFVGEATRRSTEAAIVYEVAGSHELKGKAEPVPLWKALRVVAGARGALKSEGLEAPFVGRDQELRTLKDLFFATCENGKARLVSLFGVAGIGKSRLAWELYKYLDGLRQITWYHRGRCLAYGEGVTYWALAEMVRMRALIAEGEEAASAAAKLRAVIEEHLSDPEERKWVEPRLAHLIGLEERSARDREDLFAAWRLFFERLAERNPTVMVFEDMQWADAALLDFIEYLLEWSRNHPIYVLTLARPELTDRRPTWAAGKRNFTSIYLEPLAPEAMQDMLSGLVPGLPEELRRQILERAGGVPLYAVETVRMLLDRGLVVQEGSAYRLTGPIEALEVPESLHALIAARLDGVTPEERKLVQDASVLGKTFAKEALVAVSGQPPDQVEPLLASLVRKEVLSIQADVRSPERGQYGFLQDLMRRVAYETLPKKERKARHLAAAAHLTSAWAAEDEEIIEVLASHYLDAYLAAPDAPDAGEVKSRAKDALTRAGERAASLAASAEAQRYFERAAELADDRLTQAELHERAGRMARMGGRESAARNHFERAIALFDSIALTHPAARVSAALAEITWIEGRIEEGVQDMERAFDVLSTDEPDADLATLAAQLGRLLYFMGRTDEALERIELALEIAESLRLPDVLSQALNTKALILYPARGRPEEGTALLQRALHIALENDLSAEAMRAYNNLGALLNYQDRHQEELETATAGLDLARKVGDRPGEVLLRAGRMSPLLYLGEWDAAVALAEEIRDSPDFSNRGSLPELLLVIAIHLQRGELQQAKQWLSLFADFESSKDLQLRATHRLARARVELAEGRFPEALAAGEAALAARAELGIAAEFVKDGLVEALEAAFALGAEEKIDELLGIIEALRPGQVGPFLQAQGARFGARLAIWRGEDQDVTPGFAAAARLFRDLAMPFWLAVTQLEHGEWLVEQGRADDAEPLIGEARPIFERLRARPWLERLERVGHREAAAARGRS